MSEASTSRRIESEFKLLLSGEEDANRLIALLIGPAAQAPAPVGQLNEFYDTPDRAFGAGLRILRLREEGGHFFLTAKGRLPGLDDAGALSRLGEEEVEIDEVWARAIHAAVLCPLAALEESLDTESDLLQALRASVGAAHLETVGCFRNERRKVGPIPLGASDGELALCFEFDRTEFPGGRIDWEVEVEVQASQEERAEELLRELFARAELPWRASTPKVQRFLQALRDTR